MAGVVVDASVAIKWVVEEEGSDAAATLASQELSAPTLLTVECANALWAKARRGELASNQVMERLQALVAAPVEWIPVEELTESTAELAIQLNRPVYDCLYLALALRRDWKVVTADRRFAEAVRRDPNLAGRLTLLGEL